MAMTEISREVGVVLRRRGIDNPWIDHLWSPAMILDEVPDTAPWTVLSREHDTTIYYAGAASSSCSARTRQITATISPTASRASGSRCGVRMAGRNSN